MNILSKIPTTNDINIEHMRNLILNLEFIYQYKRPAPLTYTRGTHNFYSHKHLIDSPFFKIKAVWYGLSSVAPVSKDCDYIFAVVYILFFRLSHIRDMNILL